MKFKKSLTPEKWILIGIPCLFVLGSIFHFLYNLCCEIPIVGLIAPVNESVWEHIKMVVWPIIGWWTIYYLASHNKNVIDKNKWFTAALVSLATAIITIPFLFYFYTQAFGIQSLWIDIIILLLAVLFGQLMGLHVYKHSKGININDVILVFVGIIALFMLLTLCPPELPIFMDSLTGGYGIS